MLVKELEDDVLICDWVDALEKKNTIANYLRGMYQYTEYTEKTPLQLIEEAEQEIKQGKLMRERVVKRQLIGFKKTLKDKGLAPLTIKGYLTGVKSFYRFYDIDLPHLPRNASKPRPLKKHMDIPTKDEIREVLKVCELRERAIILVGAASGLSANEIINLKLEAFLKGYDPETEITTLDLRREKVGFDFITFLTPEASKAVLDYINFRNRPVESKYEYRINQFKKQQTIDDNGYLFIKKAIPDDFLNTHDEDLRKLDSTTFAHLYRRVSDRAGKASKAGDWNKIRSHNIRKMFNSHLLNAGCDSFKVEFWMGHTLNETQAAYFRSDAVQMRDLYQKYIPYLTIQKEMDISESTEYKQILKENDVLRAETARHIVERSEVKELQEEINRMKEAQELDISIRKTISDMLENPEIMASLQAKITELKNKS
ncbi:Site-specific recombinase XerD [Methanococcoides vulcani]|uniref:Site-specific recombinase XerD n=1 Tax=Methanococcoides vulcani TaxID=1353158 RepID=A0A1I0B831_9EURY|nr:tyrosine-type recombinase/integrase [Methanococcoides vulcani]SET02211.1 Site-specific recombinase XerD [Methanococcoides vulcani]